MTQDALAITQVLNNWYVLGDDDKNKIIKQLYPELKKIAAIQRRKNQREITQSTTEVVNEAYLKLMQQNSLWKSRNHFFAIAATVMRRIVVDLTRKSLSVKRGEGLDLVSLDEVSIAVPFSFSNWLVLDKAINKLHEINPMLTSVIELRAVMGLDVKETAKVLNISVSTVMRHWNFSKAWLSQYLSRV